MGKVRGATIQATVNFIRERWGPDGQARVLQAMSAEAREALGQGPLIEVGWYDAGAFIELNTAMDSVFGSGDLGLARQAGRHTAFLDMSRFFKWLLRIGGPKSLFSRAGSVWHNYYDEGRYVAETIEDGRVVFRIEGCGFAHPALCRRVEGWMERAMEIALGGDVHPNVRELNHRHYDPRVGADKFCRYTAEWAA